MLTDLVEEDRADEPRGAPQGHLVLDQRLQ